jgi:ribosomal protein S12 methylthiotransferase
MKTACVVFVYGCPRSMMDASKFIAYLKTNGWDVINDYKKADLILLGTCGFNSTSEEKSLNFLSIACNKKRSDARLIAFGCLAGINEEIINSNYDALAVNAKNVNELDWLIGAQIKLSEIKDQNVIDPIVQEGLNMFSKYDRAIVKTKMSIKYSGKALFCAIYNNPKPLHTKYNKVFNIRIAKGCNARCSYCAIKNAVGPLRSKPLAEIMEEFDLATREGYKNFRLVADDVGSYGQDNGSSIVDLLDQVFASQADFKLIWDDFHPSWLIKYCQDLLKIFSQNHRKFGYLGFPVQSGSDRILALMNRGYKAADVKECLLALKQVLPEVDVTSHMILGFPGETQEDFDQTISFLKELNFQHFYAYKYCERPNTEALLLPGKVSALTKYVRLWQLKRQFYDTCFVG